jgi:sterol desaturase/sphingolipid hydroxylase (fatty acid hydroxylase superfamily)
MYALFEPDTPIWVIALLEWLDNFARYFVVAAPAFVVFWVWGRERFRRRLIQRSYPAAKHVRREILYSVSTAAVFAVAGTVLFYGSHAGVFRLYTDVAERGVPYLVASVVALIVLQDAYFYWTHRAMHHPRLYPHVHRVHHLSTNPSPWAAYAFAPAEAAVHAVFVLIVALVMPVHPLALLSWLVFMIVRNVLGHLSMELYPSGFTTHWLGRWHTTTTHHNVHHRRFRANYGLYFTFWDDLMGTTHRDYERVFEEVATRGQREEKPAAPASPSLDASV